MTEKEARDYVNRLLGPEKGALWWTTPNPSLGGLIPNYLIRIGREKKLFQFIQCQKEENEYDPKDTVITGIAIEDIKCGEHVLLTPKNGHVKVKRL